MRTGVVIRGVQFFYDLYRVGSLGELEKGEMLLTISSLTEEFCKVRVEKCYQDRVMVHEVRDRETGIFWSITDRDVDRGVYIINKSEDGSRKTEDGSRKTEDGS